MTSPKDEITYVYKTDERDAVRGLGRLRDGMGEVEKLGRTLAKTQRAEADAAGRLKIAQARLADARKSGKASAAQLAAAEEGVAKAQRGLVASAGEARSAALSLAKAQERAGDTAERAGTKMRGLRRSSEEGARGFASARKSIGGFSLGVTKMLGPVGLAAGAATAASGGLVALGFAAYKGAARLQLMDQKARIVFGQSFPQMERWAKRVSVSFGLTSRETLGLAGGFADMLVPMGLSRSRAAQMAQQFTKMAPILSRWSGGTFDTSQAAEALTGALTGEYDTLQRLGIPISDALVQTEALRLGLVKGKVDTVALGIAQQRASLAQARYNKVVREHGKGSEEARRASIALQVAQNGVQKATAGSAGEITSAAKAQAALSLIMKGSTDAQKAFGASQETLAARSARARARLLELRDELLVKLTPAFAAAGEKAERNLGPALVGIGEGFRGIRREIGPVILGLGAVRETVEGVGAGVGGARKEIEPLGDLFSGIGAAGGGAAKAITPIGNLLVSIGASAGGASGALEPLGPLLGTNNRRAEEFGIKVGLALRAVVDFGFKGAIAFVNFGKGAALGLASVLDGLGDVSIGLGNFLRDATGTLTGVLTGFRILAKAIAPSLVPSIDSAEREMREFGRTAGNALVGVGEHSKAAAKNMRETIPPAADAASRKLEELRRKALGLPTRRDMLINVRINGIDVTGLDRRTALETGLHRATGGWIPGYSPSDAADNISARLTAGEFVVKRPTARKLQRTAPGFLEALNSGAVDVGGDTANMRARVGQSLRFAGGGSVPEVQRFLRSTDPLPYTWGGAGPGGYDCSGLVSAAYGKITGKGGGSGQRYFTTDSIGAGQGFRPGLQGGFTVGVTPGRGHMAMQLGSLKAEARSTASGIIVGSAAASPKAFARHFYLPNVAGGMSTAQIRRTVQLVRPAIVQGILQQLGARTADTGGYLAPGLNPPIFNGTGRPERIRTGAQEDALLAEIRALRKAVETMPAARVDGRYVTREVNSQNTRNRSGW